MVHQRFFMGNGNKLTPYELTFEEAQAVLRHCDEGSVGKLIPFTVFNGDSKEPIFKYALIMDRPSDFIHSFNKVLERAGFTGDAAMKSLHEDHIRRIITAKFPHGEGNRLIAGCKQKNPATKRMGQIAAMESIGIPDFIDHGNFELRNNKCFAIIPKATFNAFIALKELPEVTHQKYVQPRSIKPDSEHIQDQPGRSINQADD
jgi:hypothetical protein